MKAWKPEKTGSRGRTKDYSELAIETCLFLRPVFSLPLRQTEGFAKSLVQLMHLELGIPDFSTLSKRSINLELSNLAQTLTPGSHVIVDSTGLKVYGKSEWHQEKHDVKAKRIWRKLHIAVYEKPQIIAWDITPNSTGDTTGAYDLLAQVEHEFKVVMGDGAYDSFDLNEAVLKKQPDAKIVIPPPSVAVISQSANTQRDDHIRLLQEGRMAWKKQNNYGLRTHVELTILRYKKIIGPGKARELPQQKTEGGIGARVLNRMTSLGMSISIIVK